ncbi:recombinase family protein, partial [Klebsiella quasipneumoniae]
MSRVFAYCRVSTLEQTTENQRREIQAAGFDVRPQRFVEEHISGSVAGCERPGFLRLLDRMENGDVLIVTKLDRLGRNAMDIRKTVEQLATSDIRVHCLALGGVDWHCCKVSDEAAFCLIQRPYISKTLLTRRISPRG